MTTVGMLALCVGVALLAAFFLMPVTTYSFSNDIDPDKVALKYMVGLIGGGLAQLGLLVWLTGKVIHAISFLPGKDRTPL